ncbi:hypothetical protein I552_7621 [Mycobacterium xenopi 3993]|nr:hypothetical protein I552_7621 [Mycobacterium xenopi 3993]
MKTLLSFFLAYCDFLYLDPRYRITDSRTSGAATVDAGLTLTGPVISWSLQNNRGQIGFGVAPTKFAASAENWFRVSIIRQYLDDYDETNAVTPVEAVAWIRENTGRIEELFSGDSAARSCEALIALEDVLATKYYGPRKHRQPRSNAPLKRYGGLRMAYSARYPREHALKIRTPNVMRRLRRGRTQGGNTAEFPNR